MTFFDQHPYCHFCTRTESECDWRLSLGKFFVCDSCAEEQFLPIDTAIVAHRAGVEAVRAELIDQVRKAA